MFFGACICEKMYFYRRVHTSEEGHAINNFILHDNRAWLWCFLFLLF